MLAMVLHPEVQEKAQAELTSVLGDRLPTFTDEDSLPYLAAIMKECYRWEPVSPCPIPRKLTVDDEYKGYLLPKGSIIMPNFYAITRNEENYTAPSTFQPERFLKDGKINPSVRSPEMGGAFGYGRRIW